MNEKALKAVVLLNSRSQNLQKKNKMLYFIIFRNSNLKVLRVATALKQREKFKIS